MSRSRGLAHIIRSDDEPVTGVWGNYVLQSGFQPIFAFGNGRLAITAFEGLIRPVRDDLPVSPSAFFAVVPEEDRLHVETLTRTLHLLNAGRYLDRQASLFVNFDPSVFAEESASTAALRDMKIVLREAGIDASRIVCEVTEQKASSPAALLAFVKAMRAEGYRIAVDDYGADESDIGRIDALKPDIVKFDAHWITHLMATAEGAALLNTMVLSFEARGIRTLFEGIEESWQLELAERCGVSMVQGFVLARPQLAPTEFSVFTPSARPAPQAMPEPSPSQIAPPVRRAGATVFGRRGVKP